MKLSAGEINAIMDALQNDDDLADAIRAELKRQQAFAIEKFGKIALAEAPFIEIVAKAVFAMLENPETHSGTDE